ncbi:hypothetical protein [Actinomadura alba]|uniref:DUF3558 domain-containing protein n=1 Tax=Actinomadura alba TaxID=406431 RepID=A0ABR7LIJ5_9ACTN|nr:hypothetical protein [Actinomadura alba]MBC6464508.1 hypothetical protein [Actinomadura alba]
MDLENELKQAMAEHVAEASAPTSLVADVHRRHRRRARRVRTTIGVAAVAVVTVSALPAAQFFDIGTAEPVGAPTTTTGPRASSMPPGSPVPLAPVSPDPRTGSGTPRAGETAKPPVTRPSRGGGGPGVVSPIVDWLTYLPSGLRPAGSCGDERDGSRRTTICRWTGTAGTVEVRLVRDSGPTEIEDLFAVPSVPRPAEVRGRRALVVERMLTGGAGSLVLWMERPGAGVSVSVSPGLRTQLMRIAEGARIPS